MSYILRAYATVRRQPILLGIPVALGAIAIFWPVTPIYSIWMLFKPAHYSMSLFTALVHAVIVLVVAGATVSGYNSMVAASARGEQATVVTFVNNLSRHLPTMLTGIVAVAAAYAILGLLLPTATWFVFTPLFLGIGAFVHLWLAGVVLGGHGPIPAVRSGIDVLLGNLAVFGVVLGAAVAVDFLVPRIFELFYAGSGGMFFETTVGKLVWLIQMAVSTAFSVVFRLAVFSAYIEQASGISAGGAAPSADLPG